MKFLKTKKLNKKELTNTSKNRIIRALSSIIDDSNTKIKFKTLLIVEMVKKFQFFFKT